MKVKSHGVRKPDFSESKPNSVQDFASTYFGIMTVASDEARIFVKSLAYTNSLPQTGRAQILARELRSVALMINVVQKVLKLVELVLDVGTWKVYASKGYLFLAKYKRAIQLQKDSDCPKRLMAFHAKAISCKLKH